MRAVKILHTTTQSLSFTTTRGKIKVLHFLIGPDGQKGPPPPLFGQSRWGTGADVTEGERVFMFGNPEKASHNKKGDIILLQTHSLGFSAASGGGLVILGGGSQDGDTSVNMDYLITLSTIHSLGGMLAAWPVVNKFTSSVTLQSLY
ncbi:hypothetical protein UPYG_G00215330 [Umbra pygmaea]|uniref:Uncharacterized protein n=1 Tax=Umbra pygmaea TaxID=75934 RepID=A0ABD0WKN7_UMBPY